MPYSETLSRLPLPKTPIHSVEDFDTQHSYRKLTALDVDEHAANLGKWDQNYDQISSGSFRGTLSEVWIGDMQIFREVTTQAVVERGQAWAGARLFGVPMTMNGSGSFCDRPLHADSMFSFGPGSEFSLQSPKEFDVVGIAIREEDYQQVVASLAGAGSKRLMSDDPAMMRCPSGLAELRVFLDSLFEVLDENPAMLSHPTVQRTVHSALMGHLCDSIQTANDMPAPLATYQARKAIVENARSYVLTNLHDTVTIADLCEALNTSRRTIQYCFQEVLKTNPVQYLRAIRLNSVRRELRRANPANTQVQDVAARWGFWHLSHFANDYRAMFGELPSDTLRRT
ncbi:MAG: helix-turn-helix domain-containing protein [Betaproteobacteria bacterium]|nr:helix-turn-helix domain-containing protein [Betaproteobacteria bacterium]